MKKNFLPLLTLTFILVICSCADRKVARVNTDQVIDLSGRWNDTDSRLVSEAMITATTTPGLY